MTANIINPIIKPMISTIFSGGRITSRVIIDRTVAALSQYMSLDTDIVLGADWQVTIDFYASATSNKVIFSSSADEDNFARLNGIAGDITFTLEGDTQVNLPSDSLLASLIDGEMHKVNLGVSGGTMFIGVDGGTNETATAPANLPAMVISNFLRNFVGGTSGGLSISNVMFEDVTNTVNYSFYIDQPTGNTELSLEGTRTLTYVNIPESQRLKYVKNGSRFEGQPILVDSGFDNASDWSFAPSWSVSGGLATCDGTQVTIEDIFQPNVSVIGLLYETTMDVFSVSAGGVSARVGGTVATPQVTTTGVHVIQGVSGAGVNTGAQADASFTGSLNSLDIRSIINIAF